MPIRRFERSGIRFQKIPNLKALPRRFFPLNSSTGELMGTTASPFLNPIAAEPDSASSRLPARALLRRARQRRQIQALIAASYLIDALILLLYAHAGSIATTIAPAYA